MRAGDRKLGSASAAVLGTFGVDLMTDGADVFFSFGLRMNFLGLHDLVLDPSASFHVADPDSKDAEEEAKPTSDEDLRPDFKAIKGRKENDGRSDTNKADDE